MTENTILITIDAFRYDCISSLSYNRWLNNTTPFLDGLIGSSLFFSQHTSTGSGTSTSFPGIHASSLPLTHGYGGLNQEHTSLAEVLWQNSVQTLGITAQTSCSSLYNYDRGFDVFKDWVEEEGLSAGPSSPAAKIKNQVKDLIKKNETLAPIGAWAYQFLRRLTEERCPYRRATEVTDTTLELASDELDKDSPFFIWVHFMEPHHPHHPPAEYVDKFHDGDWTSREINELILRTYLTRSDIANGSMIEQVSEDEINAIQDYYAAATRYVDREIERLINGFKRREFLHDTTVFLTADHGEELFDHGDLGHRPKMYDELIRVPLIHFENSDNSFYTGRIDQVTSHLDIAPTIADLFEIDPPDDWAGKSLRGCLEVGDASPRDHAIAELCHEGGLGGSVELDKYVGTVRGNRWKYIQNRQVDNEEVYDLVDDPAERENLIDEFPDQALELKELMDERLTQVTEQNIEVEMSEEVKEHLRELGYIDE